MEETVSQTSDRSVGATAPSWRGVVRFLHKTPRAFLPMLPFPEITLVAGKGIEGDRYMIGNEAGFYSQARRGPAGHAIRTGNARGAGPGCQGRVASRGTPPERHGRGRALNHLVGRRFWLGDTLLEATRLSTPCRHLEEILGKAVFDPLVHRSGLNCKILSGGVVRMAM
jgi:hypothetical protein